MSPHKLDTPGSRRVNKLLQFERKYGLFDVLIKGHRFWDYARYSIYDQILFRRQDDPDIKGRGLLRYGFDLVTSLVKYFIDRCRIRGTTYDIVVINTTDRRVNVNGKEVNGYVYPIVDALSSTYKILLLDLFGNVGRNLYPCDLMRLRALHLFHSALSTVTTFCLKDINELNGISEKLMNEFVLEIDGNIRRQYLRQVYSYRLYYGLFKKFSPKIVAFSDGGSSKGLINAAHDLGIETIDFQHSEITFQNILYNYSSLDDDVEGLAIPRYVYTFGNYWNAEVRSPSKTVSVGFPYFDLATEGLFVHGEGKKYESIVILSNGYFARDSLTEVALELSTLLPEFEVVFKLRIEEYPHWEDKYPEAFRTRRNIRVIDDNSKSIYEHFSQCSYQVGINSTAVYEGLAFGLVTFILRAGEYGEVERLINEGHVFLVSAGKEIVEKIASNARPSECLDRERLFRSNSVQNVSQAISDVMNG